MEILMEQLGSIVCVNNMLNITLIEAEENKPELLLETSGNSRLDISEQNIIVRNSKSNSVNNKHKERKPRKKETIDIDEVIANNLGFKINKQLLTQARSDPDAIIELGIKALEAGKDKFASSLFKLAYRKGAVGAAKYFNVSQDRK